MASLNGLPSLPTLSKSGSNGSFFGGSSSKNSFFGSGSFKPIKYKTPSTKGSTPMQSLMAYYLNKQQHPHHSLFGKIIHGATHSVEKAMDYLARPSYAVAAGTYDATKKGGFNVGQFLHGASQGIQGKDKKGFGQVLSEHHILQHHNFLRGLAGLGLDVATDPLTYATAGAGTEAAIAERAAEKGIAKDVLKRAITTAQKGTFRDAQHAMEVNNVLVKAGLPATRSLAREGLRVQNYIKKGLYDTKFVGSLHETQLHQLQALSQAEIDNLGARMVKVGYRAPFTKGFTVNTKLKAPSLLRVAEGQGFVGKFPGLPKAAETLGKAFKPGWRNEKAHALQIMAKHVAEDRQDRMAHLLAQHLVPMQQLGLSEQEMVHALKVGETTPGIVTMRAGRATRTLSKKVLDSLVKDGKITGQQAQFITAWHDTTEALRKADAEFGVKYDKQLLNGHEKNVLYVPHVREVATGMKPGYAGSVLAKKGFQYERKGGSQMALAEKLAAEHPDVQLATHPLEMIAKRASAGAQKQAETAMVDTLAKTFGVPTRLPNVAKQLELHQHYLKLNEVLDGMKTITAHGLAQAHADILHQTELERLDSLHKAGEAHAAKEAAMKKEIATLKGQITKRGKTKIPTARQFMGMKNDQFSKLIKGMGRHPLRNPLVNARATHKGLDALERQVSASVKKSLELTSVTGTRPHGSNYKKLTAELLDKANGLLPEHAVSSMRQVHLLRPVTPRDSWEKRHTALVEDMLGEIKNHRQLNHDELQKAIDKHFGSKPAQLKKDNFHFTEGGVATPNSEARDMGFKVHNVHDKFGNTIGSLVYMAEKGDKSIYVESVYVRPEFRTGETFRKVIAPILADGRPVAATVQNPRLLTLMKRSGIKLDTANIATVSSDHQILRGAAPKAALPKLRTKIEKPSTLGGLKNSLQAKETALAKHQASLADIEAKVNARAQERLSRRQSDLHELQHKELTKATAIGKALKRIESQVEHHNRSVRNPEAYQAGYKVVDRLKAPNGASYALPAEMAHAMERARTALNNDEFLQKFHNTWQKLVAKWKVGVTVVNPGYRVRNTLSDLWNAYISGVPLHAMGEYGAKAAKLIHDVQAASKLKPEQWTKEQAASMRLYSEMYHHGVLAGLFQGDIEKVRRFLEGRDKATAYLKDGHFLKATTTAATNMNRHAENWGRMMHYLYRREAQGLSAGESAKIVRGAHFDYEDLTPTEQAIKRTAIPFYTWTRKNIPYQISAMAQNPGRYAAFPLMANEMNQASPKVPNEIVPSWIKQGLGFHVPFGGKGNFYLPVFGPVDLEKLQHPASQGTSMLSPMLQIPLELTLNRNLNTGQQISGPENAHPRNPISGFAANLLQNIPGTNVGQTSRQVNGKKMVGPGASPYVSYFAQQTPLTNLLVNGESNIKKAQRGGGQKALISEFGGLSTYKPDQQALQAVAQAQAQQSFKQFVRGLRDENAISEAKKRKVSKAAAANNRAASIAFGGK